MAGYDPLAGNNELRRQFAGQGMDQWLNEREARILGLDMQAAPQPQSLFAPQQTQAQSAPQQQAPQQSLFSPPSAGLSQAEISSLFTPPPAPPPSQTFLADAKVNPGSAAPAPVPIVSAPSGGLAQATLYSPAPEMPGYAMPRTGGPFKAAAPTTGLWNALAQPVVPQTSVEEDPSAAIMGKAARANWY